MVEYLKEITKLMVRQYNIKKLGFDFMGYTFTSEKDLSYHHLIIPRRHGGPETKENGSILRQNTSHNYLHIVEMYDIDRFLAITSEMIDENLKGKLDIENLRHIRDVLESFEREYCNKRTKKGKLLIKESYIKDRIIL